ncbi:hypothetical protein A9Q81_18030 [Gammaproteobacteria bacterium 42_54_T18]|nr:hypothetical protein A9Q81_18030 [Gammaproteobacteria bacterium 42_54_T18]
MLRFCFILLACVSFSLRASVPEPSFVVYGDVLSSGTKVQQEGMLVSARYAGSTIAEMLLSTANDFSFSLEIPLEASVGPREAGKARISDVIEIYVAGQLASNVQVDERGAYRQLDLNLPQGFDSDGDGLQDAQEIANGSNPNDPNDPVKFGDQDLDADGISNGAEFLTGTYDPFGDADGDGYSNQDEYTLNQDPNSASNLPKQSPDAGTYSALHAHADAYSFLLAENGGDLLWDDAVNGTPLSIVPTYWNVDKTTDYLISTSQGKLFILLQTAPNTFADPQLVSLFSVPTGSDLYVGFANIDGINAPELWAFSRVSNQLYIFERNAKDAPYGSQVWLQAALPGVAGHVQLVDLDEDGVVDVVANGVDLAIQDRTPSNTMAIYKGTWDGITYGLGTASLITSQTHINNSPFVVIDNIVEAGFDKQQDIHIRGLDQKFYVDLSFNSLKKGAISESLIQQIVTTQTAGEGAALTSLLAHLNTGAATDAYAVANLNNDTANTMDVLQYTGTLSGAANKFRLIPGVISTKDQDLDGVADYKDIAANDPNAPLPNGALDFDGDGIPYGIDGNHSGLEDADSDGMPDGFELTHGLNPNDASDASSDLDFDLRTAYQEYKDGTDPNDSTSVVTQEAVLRTSAKAFERGASDMLIHGDEIVVSSQNSQAVKLFNVNNLSQMRTLQSSDVNGVSKIVSTNNLMVLGNVGGSVEIFDVNAAARLIKFNQSTSSVTDMSVNGTSLFSLHANGDVYHWNLETLSYVSHWHVYDGFLTSIYARGDLVYIQASAPEKIMFVWNVKNQTQIYTINGSAECCEKVVAEYSGDTMMFANSFSNSGIYAMNVNNFNSQEVVEGVDATVLRVLSQKNTQGTEVYVGRKSGVIDWYSADDGGFIGRVAAPYTYVRDIEIINGGFISLHSDGTIYFWEHK